MRDYGALKAACEREVSAAFGAARSALIRPGLIVGAFDPTDRFGYWVARFLAPQLLGERDDAIVVPSPGARPVQFVDAFDGAAFLIAVCEQRLAGAYNVCSERGQYTFDLLFDALAERARARGRSPQLRWADDAALAKAGVEPWTGLPLWIPDSDASAAGFMEFDCRRAHRAGLTHRSLAATIDDTAQFLESRDNTGAWKHVITAEQERSVE
jgi:2'-hydroxyisoflavone reductase